MNHIYEKSKDLHIRKTYVYAKNGDAYAYGNVATTEKIDAATLKDLFLMGMVIVDGGVEYTPTSFEMESTVGIVTYVKADGTTPTTAVLAVLKSSEFAG